MRQEGFALPEHRSAASTAGPEREYEDTLYRYAELLASCTTVRLTGSRDADELYELHVRDCLHSVPYLPEAGRIVDVGSGGGLPGMVWAVVRPDLQVTLLDSARKKCRALEDIAASLGLKNVLVCWERCEDHALSMRERYALASARALAHTGVLAEYLSPLVEPGGRLLAFKGPKVCEELEEVGGKWRRLGLSAPEVIPYGPEDRRYSFVLWEKKEPCPGAYPRKPGLALMKGWWF